MSAMDWAGVIGAGVLGTIAAGTLLHAGGGAIVVGLIVAFLGYIACKMEDR